MRADDRIYREHEGKRIPGVTLPAFIHNGDYHFVELRVFQDGMVDCWGLETFEGFKGKVEEGWVVTALPEDAQVRLELCLLHAKGVTNFVAEPEFVKEVADAIEQLNERPDSFARCHAAMRAFNDSPGEPARAVLQVAYEAVPAHRRMYLGDQDRKDVPIRMIIYGKQEVENWSHRAASRQLGLRLPDIDPAAYLEEVFPSPKKRLDGSLSMALARLYRSNGLGPALFPPSRVDEVERLARDGAESEAIEAIRTDIEHTLANHGRRPAIVLRMASALSSMAEYLEATAREPEAIATLWKALRLDPDNLAHFQLARLAVRNGDRDLARRLVDTLLELGAPSLDAQPVATAFGVDVPAFKRLLE